MSDRSTHPLQDRPHPLAPLVLASAAVLGSCASLPDGQRVAAAPREGTHEAVVAQARTVERENCISRMRYDQIEILDDRRLLFFGRGDDAWVNAFEPRCTGLSRHDAIVLESSVGGQVCDGDPVTGVDRVFWQWQPGRTCLLGAFRKLDEGSARRLGPG